MLKQLIFGKNKSNDYLFGVWIGLILGSLTGISFFLDIFSVGCTFIFVAVVLFFVGFDWFFVDCYGGWYDGGFCRGVIVSIPLAAAFILFFKINNLQWYVHAVLIIIIMELIFFAFDKKEPKRNKRLIEIIKFTGIRKLVCLLDSFVIYIGSIGSFEIVRRLYPYLKQIFPEILKWIGYVGVTILALGLFIICIYFLLYLNSYKFRRKRKK